VQWLLFSTSARSLRLRRKPREYDRWESIWMSQAGCELTSKLVKIAHWGFAENYAIQAFLIAKSDNINSEKSLHLTPSCIIGRARKLNSRRH
jgi:hypothetical protein